ncbi:vacuolar sorting-associated VTA1 -like protein [Brachionus plicatilis]|uniref:Vacuolar sorting-associated VTA1-like protein n=1 Tax=Brachionus plicatilis TaxID=10195 RepID=A0A3M7QLL9_BRAPC|nr:vacuolar sorting-associated VTA1 -like protein [Brachionus plicatilis]
MSSNLNVPEALKQLRPYLTLAGQLDQKNEVCIAYYCRLYSVQKGMETNKSAPDCKKFLIQLMDLLEALKKKYPNEESIHSEIVGQACVEKYAIRIFDKADEDDRQARFTKNLVKQFYSAGLLFDILNCFGELSEDLVVKKQYAKRKAMYLNKCFQTGETPIPGPLVGDNFREGFDFEESKQNNEQEFPPHQNIHADQPGPSPTKTNLENFEDQAAGSLPVEVVQKAQKLCKYAQSALQYDDVSTAIKNLEECLVLLKK